MARIGIGKVNALEVSMATKSINLVSFACIVAMALLGAIQPEQAQASATYATVAPLDQYLIQTKASEIELARSAAPASISDGAEVLVLGRDGYLTAVKGVNGFVCLVERSWGKTTDDPEFWNPKMRAPICVNAAAARTYLPIVQLKTRLVLAGKSRVEIAQALKSALDKKELPGLEPDAMCYMMSKQQYLSDTDMHWHPHMMWFVSGDAATSWGANLAGAPLIAASVPENRMTIFMVVVGDWSDGTPAIH
jgi:hypothetical protein